MSINPIDLLAMQQAATTIGDGVNTIPLSREMSPQELKESNIAAPGVPRVGDNGKNATVPPPPSIELIVCGQCQKPIEKTDKFCRHCGAELSRSCKKCGTENQTGKFCSNCGKALKGKRETVRNHPSKL